MSNARMVLTTLGLLESAENLAQELVERRLAACVNILGPIRSIYRWENKVQNEQEYLLLIKTTEQQSKNLQSAIKELHPYELPEIVELSITGGGAEYLSWLAAELSTPV